MRLSAALLTASLMAGAKYPRDSPSTSISAAALAPGASRPTWNVAMLTLASPSTEENRLGRGIRKQPPHDFGVALDGQQ
jgi:hypothetical protein